VRTLLKPAGGIVLGAAALAFLLVDAAAAFAQEAAPPPAPIISYPTNTGVSQPLSAVPMASATTVPQAPGVVPLHPLPQRQTDQGGQHAADEALQTKAGARLEAEERPAFRGIVQDGYIPPDPNIAVGQTYIVEVVNSEIAVLDKNGNMLAGYPKKLGSLWSTLGGGCATNNAGDPIVQYDRFADRWLIAQLGSLNSPFSECFAVSQTNDPTGAYNVYSYSFGNNLNDYGKFGVWPTASNSAYLGTYNLFANGNTFVGAELCAYDREAMLSGAPSPAALCYMVPDGGYLPSDVDGATAPGEAGYFLNFNSLSSLQLYQLAPDFTNLTGSLIGPTDIPVNAFQEACGGGTCIPQPGTGRQLDSLGDRLMYRLAYRKFSDHEAMVVNHSVTVGSSVGVRWYELDAVPGGAFGVSQQGTFAPDAAYRWMGSIAMDQAGDIALGYSLSSSSVYPGIYLTGRAPGDLPGSMATETLLQAGGGSQTGYSRWGDYTSLRIDPSDDCTFWYADEYYPQTASYNWYTFIGSFKFSGCGSTASSGDFSLSESPASQTIPAGGNGGGSVSVASLNGFNSAVNLTTTCSAPLTCSLTANTVTPPANSSATSSLMVSVAANANAGTYTNTITGTSGSLTHSTTFTVAVPAPNFTISASPSTLTMSRGSIGSDQITLASNGGPSAVTLSVSGLPRFTSASFNPNPATASGSSTLTITVNKKASPGTYTLTVAGNNGSHSNSISIPLVITQ
jgi:hypothetical protein